MILSRSLIPRIRVGDKLSGSCLAGGIWRGRCRGTTAKARAEARTGLSAAFTPVQGMGMRQTPARSANYRDFGVRTRKMSPRGRCNRCRRRPAAWPRALTRNATIRPMAMTAPCRAINSSSSQSIVAHGAIERRRAGRERRTTIWLKKRAAPLEVAAARRIGQTELAVTLHQRILMAKCLPSRG